VTTTIRQLAAGRTGNVLAAGEFARRVHLFDLAGRKHLLTLDATLDFGGDRLAVSNDGRTLVAGAYDRRGITAYSIPEGTELWRRGDLKRVQNVGFAPADSRVLCGFDHRPCEVLVSATGRSGATLRGVRQAWESPFSCARFMARSRGQKTNAISAVDGTVRPVPKASFAVLDVAFSPSVICTSEAGGPVRAFDPSTAAELWRRTPSRGHFLRLAYCDRLGAFVGRSWEHIHCISPATGTSQVILEVPSRETAIFCLSGTGLVLTSGAAFDVVRGIQVDPVPFPGAADGASAS